MNGIEMHPQDVVLPALIAGTGERAAWRFLNDVRYIVRRRDPGAGFAQPDGCGGFRCCR
jgi:hypothetical protein